MSARQSELQGIVGIKDHRSETVAGDMKSEVPVDVHLSPARQHDELKTPVLNHITRTSSNP